MEDVLPNTGKDKKVSSALYLVVAREIAIAEREVRPRQHDTLTIKDELFGFLVAGHDTTSATICWALKFLASHPEVQGQLILALRHQFKRAAVTGENPTVEEITGAYVPYLDAILEKINRLAGTSSSNMRPAVCDT